MSLRVGDLFNPAIHLKMVSDFDQDRKKPNRATVTRHCEESGSRKIVFYRKKYQQFSEAERRELLILTYAGSLNLKHVVNIRPSFSANDSSKQIIVDTLDAGLRVADWCGIRPVGVTPSRQHCLQEVGQFLRLTQACLLALKELHSHGMRHLDIKFDNICLPYTKNQNNEIEIDFDQVKLIDFDTAIFTRMPLEDVLPFSPPSDATNYQSARLKAAIRSKDVKQQDALGFDVDLYALGYMLKTIMNISLGYPESLSDADQRSLQKDIESVIDSLLQYDTQHCETTHIHEQLLLQVDALLRELKSVDGSILRYAFQINPQQVCSWDNRADYASDHVVPIVATDLFSVPPLLSIEPTDMDAPIPPKSVPIDIKAIRSNPPKNLFKRIINGFLVLLGVVMLLQLALVYLLPDPEPAQANTPMPAPAQPSVDYSKLSYDELRAAVWVSEWLKTGVGAPPAEFDAFLRKNSTVLESADRQAMLDRALLLRYGRGVDVDLVQSQSLLEQVIKTSMAPEFDSYRQAAGQALRDYGFDSTWADLGEALTPQQAAAPAPTDEQLMAQGMWRDPKTNMIWMRCSLGQTWDGSTCTGEASEHNWQAAQDAVAAMNSNGGFGGYTDWVLPHIEDLASLIRCNTGFKETYKIPAKRGGETTIQEYCNDGYQLPTIDQAIFPNIPHYSFYWSASPNASVNSDAWYVSFYHGHTYGSSGRGELLVRAVRASQ